MSSGFSSLQGNLTSSKITATTFFTKHCIIKGWLTVSTILRVNGQQFLSSKEQKLTPLFIQKCFGDWRQTWKNKLIKSRWGNQLFKKMSAHQNMSEACFSQSKLTDFTFNEGHSTSLDIYNNILFCHLNWYSEEIKPWTVELVSYRRWNSVSAPWPPRLFN